MNMLTTKINPVLLKYHNYIIILYGSKELTFILLTSYIWLQYKEGSKICYLNWKLVQQYSFKFPWCDHSRETFLLTFKVSSNLSQNVERTSVSADFRLACVLYKQVSIILMDKLQVISQIIFDGELMIFMTMTLGLRIGYLLIKSISSWLRGPFFIRGLPFLMIVCNFCS